MQPSSKITRRAFTLIEIVIVVLILVLIAVLVWWFLRPSPITVTAVHILQPEVHTAAGTSFLLEARVLGIGGKILEPDGDLRIDWESNTSGIFRAANGGTVIVDTPNSPNSEIPDIRAKVKWKHKTLGTSDATTVRIAPLPAVATGDWIDVDYVADQPPFRLVLDAREVGDSQCTQDDRVLWVVQTAFLGVNLEDHASCAPELASFGPGEELVFQDGSSGPAWTTGQDRRVLSSLPVYGWDTDPSTVPNSYRKAIVAIGMPTNDPSQSALVKEHLRTADALLTRAGLGVGLRLDNANGEWVHGFTDSVEPALACEPFFVNSLLNAAGRSLSEQVLFVLVVDDLYDVLADAHSMGLACPPFGSYPGRVFFLALPQLLGSTVAHEFGHILGVRSPLPNQGHADMSTLKFERDNLMWNSRQLDTRRARTHLGLGQVFRMNLDVSNWINASLGTATRNCQIDNNAGTCPAIDLGEPGATP